MANSYTIANENIDRKILLEYYTNAKSLFDPFNWSQLDLIFDVAINNIQYFPGINLTNNPSAENYIERWVKGYYDSMNNLPSLRTANPKGTCTDPAIKTIVKETQHMTEKDATFGETNHNLFMSAENIQGNLLEEFIASKVSSYGFLWCNGNVMRAIDFCNTDGTLFLQIKNKNNTENSSSSNIREGTNIKKWFRLGSRTSNGQKIPDYKWDILNELINKYKTSNIKSDCNISEIDYQNFLIDKAKSNPNLITNL